MSAGGGWIRPPRLRPGDLVGVAAPSGAVDMDAVEQGVAELRALGLEVRVAPSVGARHRFAAGTREQRLGDLHALWFDPEVRGIVAARGGAGVAALLDGFDADRAVAHPKVFIGYSDLTFLHSVLNARGLVTFHGPMVVKDLAGRRFDGASLRAAVFGEGRFATEEGDALPLRAGDGEGVLLGGCLSILAAAAGTPWAFRPAPEGTILFLEDLDEKPYRIDRTIWQLRASGALLGLRGIVFGDMKGCRPPAGAAFTLDDVLLDATAGLDVPVALGLSSGHTVGPNVTLPFGVRARLTCADTASLTIEEEAVS